MSEDIKKKLPEEYVLFYTYLQERLMKDGTEAYNAYMEYGHKQVRDEIELGMFWAACIKMNCDEFIN